MKNCDCHEITDEEMLHIILDNVYEHYDKLINHSLREYTKKEEGERIVIRYTDDPKKILPNGGWGFNNSLHPDVKTLILPIYDNNMNYQKKLEITNTLIHEYGHVIQTGNIYSLINGKDVNPKNREDVKKYTSQEIFAEYFSAFVLNKHGIPARSCIL